MGTLFLNATQHNLTKEQKEKIEETYGAILIKNLKDTAPKLFFLLSNSPSDKEDIFNLAKKFAGYIGELCQSYKRTVVHLPIGAPSFLWVFSQSLANTQAIYGREIEVVFSYSKRNTVENPDGSKTVFFRFEKFISYKLSLYPPDYYGGSPVAPLWE